MKWWTEISFCVPQEELHCCADTYCNKAAIISYWKSVSLWHLFTSCIWQTGKEPLCEHVWWNCAPLYNNASPEICVEIHTVQKEINKPWLLHLGGNNLQVSASQGGSGVCSSLRFGFSGWIIKSVTFPAVLFYTELYPMRWFFTDGGAFQPNAYLLGYSSQDHGWHPLALDICISSHSISIFSLSCQTSQELQEVVAYFSFPPVMQGAGR